MYKQSQLFTFYARDLSPELILCVCIYIWLYHGLPDSSVGKESAGIAGDLGSIPGLGRSPGEGIGYPLQHSWASFVAQLVKNPAAMRETCLGSIPGLGRSLGEGNCYPLQYSRLENSLDRGAWQATVHGVAKSWTQLRDFY